MLLVHLVVSTGVLQVSIEILLCMCVFVFVHTHTHIYTWTLTIHVKKIGYILTYLEIQNKYKLTPTVQYYKDNLFLLCHPYNY